MKRMSHFAGSRRGGMTLMEILVAVSILSIIVVGFGQVLTQARRTVGIAQMKMKQLQHVRAMRECFQKDLQRVSKNGVLRISGDKLILVAAGESIGRVANSNDKLAQGNAAVIAYGLDDSLLLRKAFVMDSTTTPKCDDQIELDFSALQQMSLSAMDTWSGNLTAGTAPTFPPTNASQVNALWPVLAPKISSMEIKAGKRMLDEGGESGPISWDPNVWRRELISENFSESRVTLWTRHNQNDWPDLIKITITIDNPRLAALMDRDGPSTMTYEIICPIR